VGRDEVFFFSVLRLLKG